MGKKTEEARNGKTENRTKDGQIGREEESQRREEDFTRGRY